LSECKKIQPWLNAANINVRPQANNVILQLRRSGGPQTLIARFTEYGDIVGSFFTPNWQFQSQVFMHFSRLSMMVLIRTVKTSTCMSVSTIESACRTVAGSSDRSGMIRFGSGVS